jgi:hypothetical protein
MHPGRNESATSYAEALSALNTLSYSSNLELQRSAALTFAEITEKGTQTGLRGRGGGERGG